MNALTLPSLIATPTIALDANAQALDPVQPRHAWPHKTWLCMGAGLVAASVFAPSLAHAQTSSAVAAALQALSVPLPEEAASAQQAAKPKTPAAAGAHASITVQKGESIDAVIRRGLPGLPLKEDFLRQALAKANPGIFPKGQTYPVRPGTVLVLPTHHELRQLAVSHSPHAAALFQSASVEGPAADVPTGPDKRRWVRYP